MPTDTNTCWGVVAKRRAALLLALGAWVPLSSAQTAALGTATVSAGCGAGTGIWQTAGPSVAGLQLACDQSDVGINFRGNHYSYQSSSSVNTALFNGGAVDANASVSFSGDTGSFQWTAGAGGSVGFEVLLDAIQATPRPLETVPISFNARGEATVSGGDHGRFNISATLLAPGSPAIGYSRNWEGAPSNSDGFSGALTAWLRPTTGNGSYFVQVSASCTVSAWSGTDGSCTAAADPLIRLDQAAFDLQMGANTFPLADYFALGFSPNISMVPEAATVQLWLLGLLLLSACLRHRR